MPSLQSFNLKSQSFCKTATTIIQKQPKLFLICQTRPVKKWSYSDTLLFTTFLFGCDISIKIEAIWDSHWLSQSYTIWPCWRSTSRTSKTSEGACGSKIDNSIRCVTPLFLTLLRKIVSNYANYIFQFVKKGKTNFWIFDNSHRICYEHHIIM